MIKVLFSGGLGNQMFQYAFYLWLKKNYSQIRILADLTPYKSTEYIFRSIPVHFPAAY